MKKIIYSLLCLGILTTSCNDIEIKTPTLEASLEKLNYKVGETVTFNFTGETDYAYFFSGELGKEYSKRKIFENDVNGNSELSFNSNVTLGTTGVNNKNVSILVSNDFNGLYDKESVLKATWVNITDKVALGVSTTNVVSGIVDLVPYQAADKPLYIAYRYLATETATKKQDTWTVGLFSFKTKHADGEVYTNAASFTDGVFTNVDFGGDAATWTLNSSTITHIGMAAGSDNDDDWAISKGINMKTAIGDATGVETIRTLNTGFTPTSYSYVYTTAGTYTATIAAVNATSDGSKEKITNFVIVVE